VGEGGADVRALLVAVTFMTSSCNLLEPMVECDDSELGQPMTCATVLEAARDQLAEVDGIMLVTVARGLPCDVDSLSCGPDVARGTVSSVYADLADGRRVAVPVYAEDDGSLRAGPMHEMSPSP
jgi:hypothetical protein